MNFSKKNLLNILVPAAVFLGFLVLYTVSLVDCKKVFNTNVNVIFKSDTGEYAALTQNPPFDPVHDPAVLPEYDPFARKKKMQGLYREMYSKRRHVNKTLKHLITHYVHHAVYLAGKKGMSLFRSKWTIRAERLAVVFPAAFFGALTMLFAFFFFYRYSGRRSSALVFTGLLGFSLGKWVFASIPESYSIQCAVIMLFILHLFRMERFNRKEVITAGVLAGLTLLTGVNNVLLIPGAVLFLVLRKKYKEIFFFLSFTGFVVFLGYWLIAAFVNPELNLFDSILTTARHVRYFAGREHSVFSSFFYKPLFTLLNFLLLGVGAIRMPLDYYYGLGAVKYYFTSLLPFLFFAGYLSMGLVTVRRLFMGRRPTPSKKERPYLLTLGTWLLSLFVFYTWFNAYESILYTSLFLVPFWLLVFFALKDAELKIRGYDMVKPLLWFLLAVLFINNLTFIRSFIAPL